MITFLITQYYEVGGQVTDREVIEIVLESGQGLPIGFGHIVVCDDGIVLIYSAEPIFIEVSPGRHEPMVTCNGAMLSGDIRKPFAKGDVVTLAVFEEDEGQRLLFRQSIQRK